jgi:hypothetical protein
VGKVRLQLRTVLMVAMARAFLVRRGTTATLRWLAGRRPASGEVRPAAALRSVQRAGTVLGAKCLVQSVALTAVLQRAGQEPTLVLGCRQYDDRHWGAHAWVVVGGEVFEPVVGGPHQELARLEAGNGWVPTQPDGTA